VKRVLAILGTVVVLLTIAAHPIAASTIATHTDDGAAAQYEGG
jgi:hypothetical protein